MISYEEVAGFPVFEDFTVEQINQVLTCTSETHYEKGSVLIRESGASTDVYVVIDGRVDVEIQSYARSPLNRGNKRLALLRAGDIVGEMSYIEQRRRAAKVSAFDDVRVLCIPKVELDALFAQEPKLGFLFMRNIARIISQRLTELNFLWRDDV